MRWTKGKWIGLAIASAAIVFALPFLYIAYRRYQVISGISNKPELRQRASITPTTRALQPPENPKLTNLGYALCDFGPASAYPIKTAGKNADILFIGDYPLEIILMPPFPTPLLGRNVGATAAGIDPLDRDELFAIDPLRTIQESEETYILPLSKILRMSNSEFAAYGLRLIQKAGFKYGSLEVCFFTTPYAKGVFQIGRQAHETSHAMVVIASPDQSTSMFWRVELWKGDSVNIPGLLDRMIESFRFTVSTIESDQQIKNLVAQQGFAAMEASPATSRTRSPTTARDSR